MMRNLSKILCKRSFPTRLKIGVMLFMGSFMIFMLRSNFSIIILAMTETFHWTNYEQNLLLSAYFCGYVGPNLIAGLVAERFGGRIVIFTVFLLSSVITALAPLSTSNNFNFLFLTRVTLGICGVRNFYFSLITNSNVLRDFSFVRVTIWFQDGRLQPKRGCLYRVCWERSWERHWRGH